MNARFPAIFLLAASSAAQAECSREDVQFYLERGFNHEQVAQLCSAQPRAKQSYRAYTEEYVDRADHEYQARMRLEREVTLRGAIEGNDVQLQGGYLSYIRKQCVSEGVEKDRMFGLKSCPNVRYRIRLAGLEIDPKEYKKRFLYGQRMIRVEGVIRRQPMPDAFADIPDEYWRAELRKKLESGNSTKIPLRSGVDFHFVRGTLEDMVAFETRRLEERTRRHGEEGSDDLDLSGALE